MESRPVIPKASTGLSRSQFASWSKCTCNLSRAHEVNLHAWNWEARSEGKAETDWELSFSVTYFILFYFTLSFSPSDITGHYFSNSIKNHEKAININVFFFLFLNWTMPSAHHNGLTSQGLNRLGCVWRCTSGRLFHVHGRVRFAGWKIHFLLM